MAFPIMVPSQPNSANFGNSSKVEIPPEAINLDIWELQDPKSFIQFKRWAFQHSIFSNISTNNIL